MSTSLSIARPLPSAPSGASMPAGRIVHAYYAEAKYEFLRMLRTPAFAVPVLLLPLVIYLLFGVLISGDATARAPGLGTYLYCGFSVFAVIGPGLLGVGISLAIERDAGLLKLKRALPAPPGAYLLAKMAVAMAFAAMTTTSIAVAAYLLGRLTPSAPQVLALIGTLTLGTLPMCAMGLFIGAYSTGSAAPAFGNLVFLPMMWLSGLFIPLPKFMQPWCVIWPAFHLDQLATAVIGLKQFQYVPAGICAAVLIGVTVVFGGLALRRLARED